MSQSCIVWFADPNILTQYVKNGTWISPRQLDFSFSTWQCLAYSLQLCLPSKENQLYRRSYYQLKSLNFKLAFWQRFKRFNRRETSQKDDTTDPPWGPGAPTLFLPSFFLYTQRKRYRTKPRRWKSDVIRS